MCELGESAELYQQSPCLSRIGFSAARLSRFEIDESVGKPRGRIKGGQEPVSQILCQSQESFIVCELVAGEKTAQETDCDLEVLNVNVFVEGEVFDDVV